MSLKQCRVEACRTVDEVAGALKIRRQSVYQWERGETLPTAANLLRLASLYTCTVDDLLRQEEKEENNCDCI